MAKKRKTSSKKWFIIGVSTVTVIIVATFLIQNLHPVSSKSINDAQVTISSFGYLAPLAVIFLIFVSTMIPPLPLPIPVIEIAAGLLFGFWKGMAISWIGEIVSSSCAFYFSKIFGKPIVKYLVKHPVFNFHRYSLQRRGAISVFLTRITLINHFNVISFMAGLTSISFVSFLIATSLGILPETILFPFIGSMFRTSEFNLGYILGLVFLIAGIGMVSVLVLLEFLNLTKRKHK